MNSQRDQQLDNKVMNIIIPLINAAKFARSNKDLPALIRQSEDTADYAIGNPIYLLGQIIRNIWIPSDHKYITDKAKEKWDQITNNVIDDLSYREKVVCEHNDVIIKEYIGNSKNGKGRTLNAGDSFIYRDVFHDEHIVPISDIIDKLMDLDEPNCENVNEILDMICICKMLKEEDRKIYPKYHRLNEEITNADDVINIIYDKARIKASKLNEAGTNK